MSPAPRRRAAVLVALLAVLVPTAVGPPAADAAWRPPVAGPIVARFALGPDPYAAGQRRGIDLAARPGAGVIAPCAGRVSFAGRLPDRGGAVALRCGPLTATVLGLAPATIAVAAGATVPAGGRLGAAGTGGTVRLGARRTASPLGYVDPESLLGAAASGPGPAVVRRPARRGPGRGPRVSAPAPVVPAAPAPAAAPGGAQAPLAAWAGLALLAAAAPVGALVRRRAHRPAPGAAVVAG